MDRGFMNQLESRKGELVPFCRGLLWNKADLEDAVQEVILQAFRAWPRFAPGTNFRAWLFKIATFTVYNLNRKRRDVPAPAPAAEVPLDRELCLEEAYDAVLKDPDRVVATLRREVRRAVERLNEAERTVLLLRSVADLKYQEIAEILGVPLGTVMGNLGRARAKLRRELAEVAHDV